MNFQQLLSQAKTHGGYCARRVASITGKPLRYFPSPVIHLPEVRKACAYSPVLTSMPLVSLEEILALPIPFHFKMEVARTLLNVEPRTSPIDEVHTDLTPEFLVDLGLLTQDLHITTDGYAILASPYEVYLDSPILEPLLQAADGDSAQLSSALTATFANYQ